MVVLTFSFFIAVFFTISWIVYIGAYVFSHVEGMELSALGLMDIAVYVMLMVAPLFIIWMIWNAFYRLHFEKNIVRQFKNVEAQIRQQQEFMQTSVRLFYQFQKNNEKNFILNQTELFIGELNGLIADILQRYNFITDSEAAKLWMTAEKGNKWGFAKALINMQNTSVDFDGRLYRMALKENMLSGTIHEFCVRYARLIELLKDCDQEKIFLNIIETGALGKVFAILAPLFDNLQQEKMQEYDDNTEKTEITADVNMKIEIHNPEEQNLSPSQAQEVENIKEQEPIENEKLSETQTNVAETTKENNEQQLINENEKQKEEKTEEKKLEEEINQMFLGAGVRGDDDNYNEKSFFFPKFSHLFKRGIKHKQALPSNEDEIDPLTLALERSFGKLAEDAPAPKSRLDKILNAKDEQTENDEKYTFASTNETILKLQQELEDLKIENHTEINEEENLNYQGGNNENNSKSEI